MLAVFLDIFNDLVVWEKIVAIGISGVTLIAIFIKSFKFLLKGVHEANKSIMEFLNLIPELKNLTIQFKPNGGKSLIDTLGRLENNLGHTDQKIKVIASCMGIAAFEADKTGLYTFVSKQWCEITGLSFNEAVGNGWVNIIDEEHREDIFKEWDSCMKQNREFHFTAKLANFDGKEVSIVAWPIRNIDGTSEKFFGILI